uniref:tRNA(His) guanylyltransferase n=1 Tax=Glossina brevipalpis TaxID=37001 RepID=A0A1A9X5H0_9MUSC
MKTLKILSTIKGTLLQKRNINTILGMACSRYEYVKNYELQDNLLPNVWIVIRVDALNLMSNAAQTVMEKFNDIILSYGQSDEYSFVFRKETNVYNRRSSKLLSYVTSLFTSCYVLYWSQWMGDKKLAYPPSFDGRVVLYPSDQNLRDYLSWRQADVHINNLYNTAFWNLVQKGGLTNQEAEAKLRGTLSAYKNELLFSKFGINYNNLPAMFRKGTILLKKRVNDTKRNSSQQLIVPLHEDLIRDVFWKNHSELLADKYIPGLYTQTCDDIISEQLAKQVEKTSME